MISLYLSKGATIVLVIAVVIPMV